MISEFKNIIKNDDPSIDILLDMYCKGNVSSDAFLYYIDNRKLIDGQNYNKLQQLIDKQMVYSKKQNKIEPLISVIIPTYNRKDMLLKAVHSVLNQNYINCEIIIINDCSMDGTEEVLQKLFKHLTNIKILNNSTNKNAGYNRNLGYNEANGDYIIFLDDDDYYLDNDFFAKAIFQHINQNNLSFVASNAYVKNIMDNTIEINNLNISGRIACDDYLKNFQTRYKKPLSTFTAVFKKTILDELDFKNMLMMNDSSIYLRALLLGDVYIIDDIIGVYVVHGNNISSNLKADFIIKNLEEKVWVFNEAKKKHI
ncbi:glycosyltransferase family 2 protein [Tepidibacillus marianensis]|uniref:glycosyltransferase family 2 protein n=1 Tax=Tepidibacillus marianensis TaxID=3131995 RepID=UPI0030CE2073